MEDLNIVKELIMNHRVLLRIVERDGNFLTSDRIKAMKGVIDKTEKRLDRIINKRFMSNLVLSPIDPDQLISKIVEKVTENVLEAIEAQENDPDELFSEFIPKSEVRAKFASSSTLWNWEKQGKIKSYGIGGKRFYKRSELESLIQPIKTKGAEL
jgi:CO dehydrogenase/acetyl-CoA synthase alpha subunit